MEMKSKDKYYNYGTHYMWIDAETYNANYKVIYDRSGVYWRTFVKGDAGYMSKDKEARFTAIGIEMMVCDRTDHATLHLGPGPKVTLTYHAQLDLNEFSLAGFRAYCK
jgi:hypothetical protein